MKIIVLAGGLSQERDVSLLSGAGICRTLRERGHKAYLLDVFFGLEYDEDKFDELVKKYIKQKKLGICSPPDKAVLP